MAISRRRAIILASGLAALLAGSAAAQPVQGDGPYARIAVLRPHDGDTVDFEAGYIRHLDWHRGAKDASVWYGWTVWAGARQRWFVYATFGQTAESLSNPVSPADDERDNVANVTPHATFVENGVYAFLRKLSRGGPAPSALARTEMTLVTLKPGTEAAFETALAAHQGDLRGETQWYRMVAGGAAPRYVRLRPRANLGVILQSSSEQAMPREALPMVAEVTIEILNLRPTMSYGLPPP